MTILVTGAAGFIGFHLCRELLEQGETVIGIDSLNDYYDVNLKKARLAELKKIRGDFIFLTLDICNAKTLNSRLKPYLANIRIIVHLAAYAGVRYSLKNPYPYAQTNLIGFHNMLELCRNTPNLDHFVFASSSSVYGADSEPPFNVESPANHPISFYGATKKAGEVMAYSYSHLFGIPTTGLRFFTVYGPWGRPDMAYFSFTKAILERKPITVFNKGNMKRDFTYIDDIIGGIMECINKPPKAYGKARYKIYNLGNSRTEFLKDMIKTIEKAAGKKAIIKYQDAPAGDVELTYADIKQSKKDLSFAPKTSIDRGLPRFVEWYRKYYKI